MRKHQPTKKKKLPPFRGKRKIKPIRSIPKRIQRKMISSKMSVMMAVAITASLMAATTQLTEAQTASCASNLVPCAQYLNSTKPPPSCCDPLKEAVTKDLDCLCKLYENPTLLPSMGINVTQALLLPKYCNISGDTSACKAAAPSSGSGSPSGTRPATPTPAGKDNNGVGRIAWTGMSSLLILCASFMLA